MNFWDNLVTLSPFTFCRVQMDLRSQLVTQEDFNFEDIRYIGGVDLSFTDNKNDFVHACACLVITTYPELEVSNPYVFFIFHPFETFNVKIFIIESHIVHVQLRVKGKRKCFWLVP